MGLRPGVGCCWCSSGIAPHAPRRHTLNAMQRGACSRIDRVADFTFCRAGEDNARRRAEGDSERARLGAEAENDVAGLRARLGEVEEDAASREEELRARLGEAEAEQARLRIALKAAEVTASTHTVPP